MLDKSALAKALAKAPVQSYTRNVFRSIELEALFGFVPPQPLFDAGPRISGQRFTPIGGPPALYVSEHPATSYFEANQMLASITAVAQQQAPPTVVLNLSVHIEQILDLTVQEIQLLFGTTINELTANWQWQMVIDDMVPTHVLAEAAYQSNYFQAIRFPSTIQNEEANLIIWTDKLTNPSYVQVNDPSGRFAQRLP